MNIAKVGRIMDRDEKITDLIPPAIHETVATLQEILANRQIMKTTGRISEEIARTCQKGGKVLICGNGGSAADAQHIAAELSGRFFFDRRPLFAEALHVNTSYLTAVANDYSYEEIFARLIEAKGRSGDVLIALSTSGNSKNILRALERANAVGMITVGFTGQGPSAMANLCDHLLAIPSRTTPRIQECHIVLGHIICEIVEHRLFSVKKPAVFLDRDGVINEKKAEGDYVGKWSQFSFLSGVFEAVKLFNDHGYLVIVVTNQQCVGKNIVPMETIRSIHGKMAKSMEENGARLDGVYVCPHLAADGCSCRKPGTGLFELALKDFRRQGISIDMTKSYIGDSETDILAGKKAGLTTLRLTGNYHPESSPRGTGILEAAQGIVGTLKGKRTAI